MDVQESILCQPTHKFLRVWLLCEPRHRQSCCPSCKYVILHYRNTGNTYVFLAYTSTICLAIVILYNPAAIVDSFYAQLLQIYSLMVAAIVAIALHQLTRLHAVFALTAAGSPLSLYLLFHALRSFFTHSVLRLDAVYGRHRGARAIFNRLAVVIGLPLWITILAVIARPSRSGWFQQTACDAVFKDGLVGRFFYGPIYLLIERSTRTRILFLTPIAALIMAWVVAIVLQQNAINKYNREVGIVRRVWRAVTDTYPFIRICTVILFPMGFWIAMMESGALFSNEYFIPTYGQVRPFACSVREHLLIRALFRSSR